MVNLANFDSTLLAKFRADQKAYNLTSSALWAYIKEDNRHGVNITLRTKDDGEISINAYLAHCCFEKMEACSQIKSDRIITLRQYAMGNDLIKHLNAKERQELVKAAQTLGFIDTARLVQEVKQASQPTSVPYNRYEENESLNPFDDFLHDKLMALTFSAEEKQMLESNINEVSLDDAFAHCKNAYELANVIFSDRLRIVEYFENHPKIARLLKPKFEQFMKNLEREYHVVLTFLGRLSNSDEKLFENLFKNSEKNDAKQYNKLFCFYLIKYEEYKESSILEEIFSKIFSEEDRNEMMKLISLFKEQHALFVDFTLSIIIEDRCPVIKRLFGLSLDEAFPQVLFGKQRLMSINGVTTREFFSNFVSSVSYTKRLELAINAFLLGRLDVVKLISFEAESTVLAKIFKSSLDNNKFNYDAIEKVLKEKSLAPAKRCLSSCLQVGGSDVFIQMLVTSNLSLALFAKVHAMCQFFTEKKVLSSFSSDKNSEIMFLESMEDESFTPLYEQGYMENLFTIEEAIRRAKFKVMSDLENTLSELFQMYQRHKTKTGSFPQLDKYTKLCMRLYKALKAPDEKGVKVFFKRVVASLLSRIEIAGIKGTQLIKKTSQLKRFEGPQQLYIPYLAGGYTAIVVIDPKKKVIHQFEPGGQDPKFFELRDAILATLQQQWPQEMILEYPRVVERYHLEVLATEKIQMVAGWEFVQTIFAKLNNISLLVEDEVFYKKSSLFPQDWPHSVDYTPQSMQEFALQLMENDFHRLSFISYALTTNWAGNEVFLPLIASSEELECQRKLHQAIDDKSLDSKYELLELHFSMLSKNCYHPFVEAKIMKL